MTTHELIEAQQEQESEHRWTTDDAVSLYMIDRWGGGYFDVAADGMMTVAPLQQKGISVPILAVLKEAQAMNLAAPLLIRFQDLLRHRVEVLNHAFNDAIAEHNYRSQYRGVFPIKVNQLREVVEEILDAGRPYHHGIEVGSKPEIFAGLAVHTDPDSILICNGYKDRAYIRTALMGRKLGKKVILVAEKISEVAQIVKIAAEMGVEPWIGLRVRLLAKGAGKWATSGGEHAKFGLSTAEILEAMEIMREANMASAFKLLHFHIGSQIPDILTIKRAVREAAMYYAKLYKSGHRLEYIDVGGGLAIDYDGSRSTFHSSMNYSIEEYASDIVYNIMDVCDDEKVPHPIIVSESGRATVAHHSVLVVQAFGAIEKTPLESREIQAKDHKLVRELLDIDGSLSTDSVQSAWHDLQQIKEQAQTMFELGLLDLDVKARVESLFWQIAERMQAMVMGMEPEEVPEDLGNLKIELADQHICNFSVFQSLLDHWALGQLFPIVPIHRLHERPQLESTLVDITCDSDGKVSKFIDLNDVRETLPLHEIRPEEPYFLGIFLTGAYQDIMGDIHNLFGRVNEVHVFLDPDEESGFYIEEEIPGQPIGEVLAMTQWDWRDLEKRMKQQIDVAIKQDRVKPNEGMRLLQDFERGLKDQTYLTFE
ncbi:MAG TPA: biosynthetic arginine decarboxylase [Thermoanaerobaculia bacterium]|nr:biosynthetic arginine decarboxylase [Thermoanaerobaculia bacterium]